MNNADIYTIRPTTVFDEWLSKVKDPIAKATIIKRINRAKKGNFGDHKFLGNEIWEMRIDTGKGYRVYYTQRGTVFYLLICGGDKTSQQTDIEKAVFLLEEIKKQEQN